MATTAIRYPARLPSQFDYPISEKRLMPSLEHGRILVYLAVLLRRCLSPDDLIGTDTAVIPSPFDLTDYLSPDLFVALGVGQTDPVYQGVRAQYRIWDEGKPPDIVFELASETTVKRDLTKKLHWYAAAGVREYVLYDPLGKYYLTPTEKRRVLRTGAKIDLDKPRPRLLTPRLQVYALQDDPSHMLPATEDGAVWSPILGKEWIVVGNDLRLRNAATGELVLTPDEQVVVAEMQVREAEAHAAHEAQARQEAEARLLADADELARLRAEIARLREQLS